MNKKLFISYSHEDAIVVKELAGWLDLLGFSVWFDDDLRSGQDWHSSIYEQIDGCDVVLIVLTSSFLKSKYCQWEVMYSLKKDKSILPIILDNNTEIPSYLSHIQHFDLSREMRREQLSELQRDLNQLQKMEQASTSKPNVNFQHIVALDEKFEYPPGIEPLSKEMESAASQLSKVSKIRVKYYLREVTSNSQIVFVDVDPVVDVPPPHPTGNYYLKIHPDDEELEGLLNAREFLASGVGRHVSPSIADYVVSNGRLVVLYEPALKSVRPQDMTSLVTVFDRKIELAIRHYIPAIGEILCDWNETATLRSSRPYDVLRELLGSKRTDGDQSIQNRVYLSMGIESKKECIQLLFGGKLLLPNPLAFLTHQELWQNEMVKIITFLSGHVHGDLHSGNVICEFRDDMSDSVVKKPEILDFGTYQRDRLVFFDFAYLELDIIMRVCSPDRIENRRQLLKFFHYLLQKSNFLLSKDPPGRPPIPDVTRLLRPLREAAKRLAEARSQDYEVSYWLAAVAAGLNFARKRTPSVDLYLNKLGLIYAAVALKHVLDDLAISYWTEGEVPSIKWINAETTADKSV